MRSLALLCGCALLLASCGVSEKDRAVSGGGIGAGLGGTIGLVTGGPLAGIVLGGAFGAAAGLVTDEDTIDLGDPLWNNDTAKAKDDSGDDPISDDEGPRVILELDGEASDRIDQSLF